jgi:hypothetical protein
MESFIFLCLREIRNISRHFARVFTCKVPSQVKECSIQLEKHLEKHFNFILKDLQKVMTYVTNPTKNHEDLPLYKNFPSFHFISHLKLHFLKLLFNLFC